MEFVIEDFSGLGDELGYIPRGTLLEISFNPFNGNVLIASQRTADCDKLLRKIYQQATRLIAPKPRIKKVKTLQLFEEVA